jgi:small conductance mechanosensitive channel
MESFKAFITDANLLPTLTDWAINIVLALVIYIIGKWVSHRVANLVRRLMERASMDPTLVSFLSNIVYAVLLIAVILAALDTLGIPVTSLMVIVGAAGLAVGLAMKDSLGNFASGVMLVLFRPFTRGDFVEVAGVSGTVQEVRIFNTVLTTPDNKLIIIPNAQISADTITNYSANDTRRVDLVFGVAYDDDLKKARAVLTRICAEHPLVLDEPATNIFVLNLGDSSVDFAVRPWVKSADYWTVYGDLLETGKVELEAAGCSIPFPQRDVHMYATNPLADLLKR